REGTGCLRDWRGPRQWPRRYSVCYESSRVGLDLLYRRQFLALRVASWLHSVSGRMPSVWHASKAASCAAFFLLLPKPVPMGSPSTVTCAVNSLWFFAFLMEMISKRISLPSRCAHSMILLL